MMSMYDKGNPNERGAWKVKKKKNSRGSGKRDYVVAEGAHPCDTKLGERDLLSVRYARQAVHELEVVSDVLCDQRDMDVSRGIQGWRARRDGQHSHLILETAEPAPVIAFLEVQTVLDLTRE
jgi:hypothetical protein